MKYLSVLFLLFLQLSFSQIGFEEEVVIDDTFFPKSSDFVGMFDMDGDGDDDMLTTLFWYENIDGQVEFETWYNIGNSVGFVYGADIDSDGDIDVVSASGETITWYENIDSQNAFGEAQTITTGATFADTFGVADMNSDGYIDVYYYAATVDGVYNGIFWYENDGQGNFGNKRYSTNNVEFSLYTEVATAYINGDNDIDFLTINDEKLYWYRNSSGNMFRELIADDLVDPKSIYATDIDNDGDIDVFVTSNIDNKIVWYENDGQGDFGLQQVVTNIAEGPTLIHTEDIDADGDLDVLAAFNDTNKFAWFENIDGQGNFGMQQIIALNVVDPLWIYTRDVDDDGVVDVCYNWYWFENSDGQVDFGPKQSYRLSGYNPQSLYVEDLDGDGDNDLLSVTELDDSKIVWYKNLDGQGTYGMQKIISLNVEGAFDVYAADLDGDADMDIISASYTDDKIAWYENEGQGNFGTQQVVGLMSHCEALCIADVDGDGDSDIVSGIINSKIIWYENTDGLGDFASEQIIGDVVEGISVVNSLKSLFSADIDNDGDMDVLAASTYSNEVFWYENEGQGDFGIKHIITSDADGARSVYAVDIDGDSYIDVVSASVNDDKIAWYKNTDGQGSFGEQQIISTNADWAWSVYAEDLDGDGDMDVLSASKNDNKIAWYENTNGLGGFGAEQIISINADGANSIIAADINGDGRIDILSTSVNDDKLAWYKNIDVVSNKITGNIIYDLNLDGCDALDLSGTNNIQVTSQSMLDSFTTFSLSNGLYQTFPGEGEYTTSITSSLPPYYSVVLNDQVSNFVGIGNVDNINFCIQATQSIDDLNILVLPISQARPGFDTDYELVYENNGTTQLEGSITLVYNNSSLTFLNASESVASQTSDSITFSFTDLNPFEFRTIDLQFNILPPPTVNGDDVLQFIVDIISNSPDNTPDDNIYSLEQTVVNSFDPNDKKVLQGDEILEEEVGNYLDYIIRFQNVGTASAINVRVEDVLDNKLDWETFRPISSSHDYTVQITNGNYVKFIFNDIYLPDSASNEPESHGYIAYRIKPKSNVAVGDIISGTADIFFDFNPAITTNTVNTEIVEPLNVEEFDFNKVRLYPNPAKDKLEIASSQTINKLLIFEINGRVLKEVELSHLDYTLDVSHLSKGVYFLEIETEISKITKKFIKN